MKRSNPVLSRYSQQGDSQGNNRSNQPSVTSHGFPAPASTVSVDDVVVKTGLGFVFMLPFLWIGWQYAPTNPLLLWGSLIAAFAVILVSSFRRKPPGAGTVFLYAMFEGVVLGGISSLFASMYGQDIVGQAVLGTLVGFAMMLTLYRLRIIKVTQKFRAFMTVALVSYMLIAVASLVSAFFGVGEGWGFYGVGVVGIALSLLGVGLATFTLLIDFDNIEQSVTQNLPSDYAWGLALGLMVTLVWLYLELLRTIGLTRST